MQHFPPRVDALLEVHDTFESKEPVAAQTRVRIGKELRLGIHVPAVIEHHTGEKRLRARSIEAAHESKTSGEDSVANAAI